MMASLEPYIALRAARLPAQERGPRDGDRGMNFPQGRFAACLPLLALLLCGFGTPNSHKLNIAVIVTAAPAYDGTAALRGEERFPRGAQLLLVKDGSAAPLVEGFAASADANVSFDAQRVLFAGKKSAGDPWAIWELTLSDHSLHKVMGGATDVVRPMYLPGDRLVYARRGAKGVPAGGGGTRWFGKAAAQFHGREARLPDDVLADGRILFESEFPLGEGKTPEMFLVYSDGSGVESYRCDHGTARWGGRQLASGDVVFTHGASLARFTSPLAHEVRVAAPQAEYAGAIAELESGEWLLSARPECESELRDRNLEAGHGGIAHCLFARRREPGRTRSADTTAAAQQASFGAARLGLRKHAGDERQGVARGRFESAAGAGAIGDAGREQQACGAGHSAGD